MGRSKQKDKNKEGWGIRTPADVMSHTFEPHVHSWQSNTNGQKATHAHSVCLKSAVFAHTSTDEVRYLDTRLTSLCVQQTNHPHQHMHRAKGVAVERGVIYRLASSERGRRRDGEQVKAKEKSRNESKVKGEVWADWASEPPDSLHFIHTGIHKHIGGQAKINGSSSRKPDV